MQMQKYLFQCRFTSPARLPDYLGSTLRGALGWALKKTGCALRRQSCQGCPLIQRCAYGWLFATESCRTSQGQTVNARPHPMVIQPEPAGNLERESGDLLRFTILLFGPANDFFPHLVHAIRYMGKVGIGRGRRQGLGRFLVEQVHAGGETCFDRHKDKNILNRPQNLMEIALEPTEPSRHGSDSVQINLRTPLRLKRHNRLHHELPFSELIRACLRRISALEAAYGQGEPDLDYAGLINQAREIETRENQLRWQELFRWSNRQRKKISLAGLAGSCGYAGDVSPFLPLLTYCQEVHIGKQTIFGLGWLEIQ